MSATQSIAKRYFIPEYSSGGLEAFEIFLCRLNFCFRFGASFRNELLLVSEHPVEQSCQLWNPRNGAVGFIEWLDPSLHPFLSAPILITDVKKCAIRVRLEAEHCND